MVLSTFNKELYEKNLKEYAYNDGVKAGETIGFQKGAEDKLRQLIQKKLAKGLSAEEIAEDLEESPETISKLIRQISDGEISNK